MTTTTITANDIIRRYAGDIAHVADQDPATDLDAFIDQLDTAAPRFSDAGINGHEDLETAAVPTSTRPSAAPTRLPATSSCTEPTNSSTRSSGT